MHALTRALPWAGGVAFGRPKMSVWGHAPLQVLSTRSLGLLSFASEVGLSQRASTTMASTQGYQGYFLHVLGMR